MAHFHSLNERLKECHKDKAILETYFRTTAQKIRAQLKRTRLSVLIRQYMRDLRSAAVVDIRV